MNILFLTYQGGIAGSTHSIAYLARGLASRGHRIFIGCPADALLADLVKDSGVTVLPMTFRSKVSLQNMRQIRDAVRDHYIDIVNAQSSKDRYTSIFAKRLFRLDTLVVHTRRQKPESIGGPLQNWLYTHGTAKIVAVSNGVKQLLIEGGLPEGHIEVIHNGTPPSKYASFDEQRIAFLRGKYGLAPSSLVVGCVSRRKQQDQIVKALVHVTMPLTLLLVGIDFDPAWEKILNQYPARHRIICTGRIPAEEALAHYGLFTCKVLASNMEGLSQSLLEAMGFGVPVIATRAAGNIDLIQDGRNGIFFEEGDTQGLARHMEKLLSDADLRARLSEAGRRTTLETFSIEHTISNYEAFFIELCNAAGRPAASPAQITEPAR